MALRLRILQENPAILLDIRDLLERLANPTYTFDATAPAGTPSKIAFPEVLLEELAEESRRILEAAKKAEERT